MKNKFNSVTLLCTVVIATLYGTSALKNNALSKEAQATVASTPPAIQVDVTLVEEHSIRRWKEFSGRLTAVGYVEIRPQASGLITEVKFVDGQFVAKGDVLYIIDPRPSQSIVAQRRANLISAEDSYNFAVKEYKRTADLVVKKMISEQALDSRMNNKLVANANVKLARAELSTAEINLGFAYIKAPISGRISRTELTLGNLVTAGPLAPLLTTIVTNDRVYADFEVDEQTYLQFQGASSEENANIKNPVEMHIGQSDDIFKGKIHAFDNKIDPSTGTIRARAIFDNPQGKLLAGMYARLRLGSKTEQKSILISERAISTDQNRKFVYVVNTENKTTYREVVIGKSIEGNRMVTSGLVAGDKVVIRGLMRIRPNMLVEPNVITTVKIN